MNFHKIHEIFEEYKHSPFFYCFIFLSITEAGIEYPIIYDLRETYWSTQIWISVLVTALTITFFIKVPVNSLLKSKPYVKKRTPLLQRGLMGGIIWAMLVIDMMFFLAGIFITIGINHPITISSKPQFEKNHIAAIVVDALLPFFNYLFYMQTKNHIRRQVDKFYNEYDEISFAFPFVWMIFIISLIVVVIINGLDP